MHSEHHGQFGKVICLEKIDITNAGEFKEALQSLSDQGYKLIKLDCAALEMIDSAGLGTLVMFQKRFRERGGELKLINVNHEYIKHLFDMIEFHKIISIENSDI